MDDIQDDSLVGHMHKRVDDVLRLNSKRAAPPRSKPSGSNAQTTALLCDVEKFAKFTELATRKRNIAALCTPPSTTDGQTDDFEDTARPKRPRHTPRDQSPTVTIPKTLDPQTFHGVIYVEESLTNKCASLKRLKTHKHATSIEQSTSITESQAHSDQQAPMSYPRMGNVPLMLSPAKYKNAPPTEAPYNDISEEDAHPCLSPILWRSSDSSSQGYNSPSGFKSGRSTHARAPLRGPPLCKDLEWTDLLEHINPSKISELRIHSPFISTSSRMLWLLRKALREGDESWCISAIDSSALDPQSVYYVPPFHTELKKRFVFNDGAQYYKGISEHLVWNEIPPSAMITTVSRKDFFAFVNGNKEAKRLLRLKTIKLPGKLAMISRILKRDCIKITDSIAVAIAELVMFFGLDHTSCADKLSCFVYEIAQGWELAPDGVTQSSWQTKAQWFTHTICRQSDEPVNFIEQSRIYHA